jgi:hypothetical protein
MSTPTPRVWFLTPVRQFAPGADGRRWRQLTDPAKLLLFYAHAAACMESPEATWPSRDALVDVLQMMGRKRGEIDAPLTELQDAGYLSVRDDGSVELPEWDAEQYAASREIRLAYEADRARKGRGDGRWRKTGRQPNPDATISSTPPPLPLELPSGLSR